MPETTENHPQAVVLLSGGLDSATTLACAREAGFELNAISFDYGQRHVFELEAAARVADAFAVRRHLICPIDLRAFGGSALTDNIDVPRNRPRDEISTGIPITYVPARNTVFLSLALGWAEVIDAASLFIGVNAVDYSGYPDCRPEFVDAFQNVANLGTRAGVQHPGHWAIHAPLVSLTKAEIVQLGTRLGVDYSLTHSCYDPDSAGRSCGLCDSCQLRLAGFAAAGLTDPIPYQ